MAEDTSPQQIPVEPGDDTVDMDAVADRLEAALDRIARHLDAARAAPPTAELAARVDGLIVRLRDALERPPGPSRD
jgi:hypothetical protein